MVSQVLGSRTRHSVCAPPDRHTLQQWEGCQEPCLEDAVLASRCHDPERSGPQHTRLTPARHCRYRTSSHSVLVPAPQHTPTGTGLPLRDRMIGHDMPGSFPQNQKFHTELRYRYWTTCTDGQATPHPFSWPAVPSLHPWNNRQFQPGLFLTAVLLFSGLSNGQWQVTETSNHATFTGSENLTIMMLWEEKKLNLTTKAQTEFLSLCSRAYISLHMELYIWLYFWTQSIWAITLEILSCALNSRIYNLKDVSTQNHSWHGNHYHTNRRLAPFLKKSFWQNGISD